MSTSPDVEVQPIAAVDVPRALSGSPVRRGLDRVAPYGSIIVLVAMVGYFALSHPDQFWTRDNLIEILNDGSLLAIIAGGLTLALISLDFDLSVGAMATLSGLTAALLLAHDMSLGLAILLTLGLGLVVGLVNGFVVVRLGVSAFIGTLAVMTILQGLGTWWADGASVNVDNVTFTNWATDEVAGIPLPVVVMGVWYLLLWFLLERTTIGRRIYVVGANPLAARLGGMPVSTLRIAAFVASALAATVAGLLLTSKLFGAYPAAGDPFLLDAYAAVFLGAVTVRLGQFHILGTLVGVLLLSVMSNGLTIVGAEAYVTNLLKGGILIAAVALAGTSGTLKRMAKR
jgi:ribose transport system permease protein